MRKIFSLGGGGYLIQVFEIYGALNRYRGEPASFEGGVIVQKSQLTLLPEFCAKLFIRHATVKVVLSYGRFKLLINLKLFCAMFHIVSVYKYKWFG